MCDADRRLMIDSLSAKAPDVSRGLAQTHRSRAGCTFGANCTRRVADGENACSGSRRGWRSIAVTTTTHFAELEWQLDRVGIIGQSAGPVPARMGVQLMCLVPFSTQDVDHFLA